jgi:O-antigen ligase/polysaccharide polymerase Wzy-like membrane protein
MLDSRRLAAAALLLLPAGLMAYFAFNSGGFYPEPPAYVAIILCLALLVRSLVGNPFEGAGWMLGAASILFGAYVLLVLISQAWSHAPGRAAVEFDRALLYLAALVLFGSIGRTRLRLVWLLRGLLVAIFVICTSGLIARVLPHLWPTTPTIANNRLSFPVSYWNVEGLVAAFGLILCVHFSSDRREHPVSRVLASAAAPILASTLYFTFSRGAIGVTAIGIVAYLLVGRPRLWLSALVAIAPPTAVAVKFCYDADLLASPDPTTAGAVSQGHRVAVAVALCAVAAALLRALLTLTADRVLVRARLPDAHRRRVMAGTWGAVAVAVIIALVALRGTIAHDYHRFTSAARPGNGSADLRARLTDPGNDGRIPVWRVAWSRFQARPVLGQGAGTFETSWDRYRSDGNYFVVNAHSLYLENLDELGIVGLVLLVAVILLFFAGALARARGPDRPVYAAVFAVMLAWAIHAGVDWDWQMPVVTLVIFSLGGFVLARSAPETAAARAMEERRAPSSFVRSMMGIGCVLLAVAPTYMWLSQRDLNDASSSYNNGDCRSATRAAVSSIAIVGNRGEPYQVLSYCDVQADKPQLAITTMAKAVSLDPNNWIYRYGLAIMKAAAGQDPRGAARKALSLNPRESLVREEFKTLNQAKPSQWSKDGYTLARAMTTLRR